MRACGAATYRELNGGVAAAGMRQGGAGREQGKGGGGAHGGAVVRGSETGSVLLLWIIVFYPRSTY